MPQTCNIAACLPDMARRQPHALAVVFPQGLDSQGRRAYTHLTYAQLDAHSDAIARGLQRAGLTRGMRTVLMVKPSLPFFALTFALFKAGIVPRRSSASPRPMRRASCSAGRARP
jgi:acyl-CoA synthetase (AMP-forming)/AMP-acid ligase II